MASAGRDVADGAAAPISKNDAKISGSNSKKPDVKSLSSGVGNMSLNYREHVCNHGGKNKADVEPQPQRPQPQPERPRPVRKERLEDVFQDEVVKRFPKMPEFKKFARSGKGLRLSDYEVENIMEDCRGGEEQRMQMLSIWRQKLGKNATPQKIRELVEEFFKPDEDES